MNNGAPTFSLVVNTTDRAGPLRTLLRVLEHQSWPHFEVIVVVGPTEDDTEEILTAYEGRVQVLTCPAANLGQSRNIGLRAARGDIVAFIDDDAVPCRRWLEQLARLFENNSLDGTGGSVYLIDPHQPAIQHRLGIISSLAEQQDVCTSRLDPAELPGEGRQWVRRMMGTNMAFRREALLAVGGFDEFFEWVFDDADIALRLVQAGYRVTPVLEAPVYHVPASSRNRVAHSYNVKWWFQTKAAVYVAIKHGRAAGDPLSSILLRCGHLIHGHWKWSKELWREDKLTFGQFARMRAFEVIGGMQAMVSGFFRPRRLLSTMEHRGGDAKPPVRIFPDDSPDKQAAVDPIHGHRPTISMPDPPLRICLLSSNYPPAQQEGVGRLTQLMAQGLFERGHTVHVVTHGAQDRISYRDGAYVHEIPYKLERYDRYRPWPNLYH
ncbi:MAG: glycosyltransferase, partial [Anaerolineae bacterium]